VYKCLFIYYEFVHGVHKIHGVYTKEERNKDVCCPPALLLSYHFKAHQHKTAGVKTEQSVKQRLQRLLIRCSLCWGRRPHCRAAGPWTGAIIISLLCFLSKFLPITLMDPGLNPRLEGCICIGYNMVYCECSQPGYIIYIYYSYSYVLQANEQNIKISIKQTQTQP